MTRETYILIENYMKMCMQDSAHDKEHVYRVLYTALDIAEAEDNVDYDVLITACMLHDIGRKEQFENPKICHAAAGSEKAYAFLSEHGFDQEFCEKVRHCIMTHRFRKNNQPQSIEAKILFDADKIEVTGAVGIARTLIYKGIVGEPIYHLSKSGEVSDGTDDTLPSFFQEYKYKLENIYTKFYTEKGAQIAKSRQAAAVAYYKALYQEVSEPYRIGQKRLEKLFNSTKSLPCRKN